MTLPSLHIETLVLGPWQTNAYLLWTEQEPDCWVFDPGFEPQPLLDRIDQLGLQPTRLLLTHGHLDHIAGLEELKQRWPQAAIAIHHLEADFLTDPALNLSAMLDQPITAPPADVRLDGSQGLDLLGHRVELRHLPGHSPGGLAYYLPDHQVAIVGDSLFAGSIGRYDFPTSDGPALLRSIRRQLLSLPDDTRILPGHGPATTVGHERAHNPFL